MTGFDQVYLINWKSASYGRSHLWRESRLGAICLVLSRDPGHLPQGVGPQRRWLQARVYCITHRVLSSLQGKVLGADKEDHGPQLSLPPKWDIVLPCNTSRCHRSHTATSKSISRIWSASRSSRQRPHHQCTILRPLTSSRCSRCRCRWLNPWRNGWLHSRCSSWCSSNRWWCRWHLCIHRWVDLW